jgi:hypothetical protein
MLGVYSAVSVSTELSRHTAAAATVDGVLWKATAAVLCR